MILSSFDNFFLQPYPNLMKARFTSSIIRAVGDPEAAQSRNKIFRKDLYDLISFFFFLPCH